VRHIQVTTEGQKVTYTYTVKNNGAKTLTNVVLVDDKATPTTLTSYTSDLNDDANLEVGETWTYTYVYTITQKDIDDGLSIKNTATVTAKAGTDTLTDTDTWTVAMDPIKAMTLTKTADVGQVRREPCGTTGLLHCAYCCQPGPCRVGHVA
jgi:uncharacterized repeat protein (TIGR01451 family)